LEPPNEFDWKDKDPSEIQTTLMRLELPRWKYVFGKVGEQQAVLMLEGLYLEKIRQLELELLRRTSAREMSREIQAAHNQLAQKDGHELLHDYRQ
jgi:hypothetical protein